MWIRSSQFNDGDPIPEANAFGAPHPVDHVTFAANKNPHLEWGDVPDATRSFALTVIDQDVPTVGDDVNQEGREVPADLPRTTFVHWLLVDLPADTKLIAEGEFSNGVVPHGKPGLSGQPREGINDYTGWFAGDADMAGTYKGYDGPCPPWNDVIVHCYEFTVHALDVEKLELNEDFTVDDVAAAIEGHVLDSARTTGKYSLNPRVLP